MADNVKNASHESVAFQLYLSTYAAANPKNVDEELAHFARCLLTVYSPTREYKK